MDILATHLEKLEDLLSDQSCFTQGSLARNPLYESVNPNSPDATCWCLTGAAERVTDSSAEWNDVITLLCYAIKSVLPDRGDVPPLPIPEAPEVPDGKDIYEPYYEVVADVNDETDYRTVMRIVRQARTLYAEGIRP